jgi:TonB family protein
MTCRTSSACDHKPSPQGKIVSDQLSPTPAWLHGQAINWGALCASLLFHIVILGAVLYAVNDRPSAHPGQAAIEVVLMQGAASPAATSSLTPRRNLLRAQGNLATTSPTSLHTDVAKNEPTTNQYNSSAPSETVGVSIPADYAAGNRKPIYPLLSRRQEEEGTVLLSILVKADGTAETVQVKQSSGYPLLDESALAAVRHWRFRPAMISRQPVSEWYQLAIPFKLEG